MNWWPIYYRLREAREGIARNAWASLATIVLLTLTLLLFGEETGTSPSIPTNITLSNNLKCEAGLPRNQPRHSRAGGCR